MPKHQLTGNVISAKAQKTVVVNVERIKQDLKYKRRYKVHKKYKAHAESEDYKVGDVVVIEECRPISKDKKWKVIKKISSAKVIEEVLEEILEGEKAKPESVKEEVKEN